nr:DUF3883 domain-containing protein [Christiangramia portivictoriae]
MNYQIIEDYISQYKNRFPEINQMEIYKWKAVKHFQDHWDIEADDFAGMLKESLDKTKNLLGSGSYYPRRMVKTFAEKDPEEVRRLFRNLFNEALDLETRYDSFKAGFDKLASQIETDKDNHYQDHRAAIVYLALRYPQEYYLYKYRMLKDFCELIDYPYEAKIGDFTNVLEFQSICSLIKAELLQDDELLNLHHKRLLDSDQYYQDPSYKILTQDFIYACVNHLDQADPTKSIPVEYDIEEIEVNDYLVGNSIPKLNGNVVDFEKKQKANSRLGKAGEHFILDREREKLQNLGVKRINKKLEHSSVIKGDGIGYDITSRDDNGKEIFIEVKATMGDLKHHSLLRETNCIAVSNILRNTDYIDFMILTRKLRKEK